jgi:hypothetical protein
MAVEMLLLRLGEGVGKEPPLTLDVLRRRALP